MSNDPATETSADDLDFASIAKQLGEPRRELLQSFLETEMSVVNTADLREETSVPRGSVIHHLERLVMWGLVEEQPEREYHGRGGREARAWQLTERGAAFCEEHVDTPVSAFVSPEDVVTLNQRIDEVENDVDEMKDLMMRIAVTTGTITEDQAKEALSEVKFQELFGD